MTENTTEEQKSESREFGIEKIPGLLIANYSVIAAILAYMGWDYQEAYYGNFQVHALDLGSGLTEYLIRSVSLFNPIFVAIAAIAVAIVASKESIAFHIRENVPYIRESYDRLSGSLTTRAKASIGVILTGVALLLILAAGFIPVSTYALLTILASGPIFLTRNNHRSSNGRKLRVLTSAIVIICTLWAGSIYAQNQGIDAARQLAATLQDRTAVEVFSVNRLAISGPGIIQGSLPPGNFYRYYYTGLRLLTMRSGTYYLLPVKWTPLYDPTYIVNGSDQVRINLYGGVQPAGAD